MPNNIKHILRLGACAFFLSCGTSSNERGIASATSDPTATGSAYKSNDGFAPETSLSTPQTPVVLAPSSTGNGDTSPVLVTAPLAPTVQPGSAQPTTTQTATKPIAKPAAADDNADIKRGEALISKSDCLACHKVDVKVLGPSYKDVANKYPNNAATVNQLVDKIKKGGSGVWGAIPMSPHPALSDDDAKAMVRYILSLK